MRLTGMDIRDTPPFTELVEFDFDERANVFIGPNASGKSVLLREIDSALDSEDRRPDSQDWDWRASMSGRAFAFKGMSRRQYQERDWLAGDKVRLFTREDWPNLLTKASSNSEPPVVYIGPVRTALPELHDEEDEDDSEVGDVLKRPFSGANCKIANDKIHQMATAMIERQKEDESLEARGHHFFKAIEIVECCLGKICAEAISDATLRNYVAGRPTEDLDRQPLVEYKPTIHRSMGISTIDRPNFDNIRPEDQPLYSENVGQAPLYAGFLSSGTQMTFLWIYWLALKMFHHYDFAEGWHKEPAILLIDEIENHLHPTWQRRVIPALLEHFPGLQIFATTHSPFVVAGLRAGQVHLLDRNSEGVVTATATEQDIIGWTTDEILRTFMGVAQPTDELTIRRSNRLRELRRIESLSDEEREELETLRRQVNADLMSSRSPLDLQRERYGEMMMRFIESRKAQLSQDGA